MVFGQLCRPEIRQLLEDVRSEQFRFSIPKTLIAAKRQLSLRCVKRKNSSSSDVS